MKEKEIEICPYNVKLTMIKVDDLTEINHRYNQKIKADQYDAVVFVVKGDIIAAFEEKYITNRVIVHEAVHIVNQVFKQCYVDLDLKNDETQAYLTDWIFNELETFLVE